MGSPSKEIVPDFGGVMPMIERTVVVLPMPLRPRSDTTSAFPICRSMPKRTWLRP
jgi:hypothetical protein